MDHYDRLQAKIDRARERVEAERKANSPTMSPEEFEQLDHTEPDAPARDPAFDLCLHPKRQQWPTLPPFSGSLAWYEDQIRQEQKRLLDLLNTPIRLIYTPANPSTPESAPSGNETPRSA